jgi:hypothetical protein
VLILLLLFLVYCARATTSRLRIDDAAHSSARAASLAASPALAATDARAAAQAALADAGITCRHLDVAAEVGGLTPGTLVRVTLSCTVPLADLALLGLPGGTTLHASAASPVDLYGGEARGFAGEAP